MAEEVGIPLPPVAPPEPLPPIAPEPPPKDNVVRPPVTPTPAPTPAPPVQPELPPSGGGGGGFPDLLDLAGLLLVLGILALLAYITGLVNFIMRVVWGAFGRRGAAPQLTTQQLGQPVSSLLAPYVVSRDAQLGAQFANMGATVSRVGRAILAAEETLFRAVETFLPLQGQIATQARHAAHLSGRVSQQEATQDAAARQAALAQAQARLRAHGLSQRLTEVEAKLGAVVATQHELVHQRIPGLEKGQAVANDQLREHNHQLGADGLALGVAAALGTLNAGWTRCENNGQLGRANCGLPSNLLKDLLAALTVIGFGTFTLVELAKWEKGVIVEAKDAVAGFWAVNLPHS